MSVHIYPYMGLWKNDCAKGKNAIFLIRLAFRSNTEANEKKTSALWFHVSINEFNRCMNFFQFV